MEREEFEKIMAEEDNPLDVSGKGGRIYEGLRIMVSYLPKTDIKAAEHDMVYACDVDSLVEAGITKGDAEILRALGWFVDEDGLAHFA